jgi:GTP-binding protein HflX
LELDRREIRARIAHLKKQIESVRVQRREHRRKRRREGLPVVAIVGYTNAGKSTLLNALVGATHPEWSAAQSKDIAQEGQLRGEPIRNGVYVADQLFATLDPTTRRVKLPSGSEVLFTDTVGFIQKLPTQLVAAFHATLEEIAEADLLLQIVDATHHNAAEHLRVVNKTLDEIGAGGKAALIVLNKMDKPAAGQVDWAGVRQVVTQDEGLSEVDIVNISALKRTGLEQLLGRVEDLLGENLVPLKARIPYRENELVALFHQRGIVEKEEFTEQGTVIAGRIAAGLVPRFQPFALKPKPRG